MFYFYKISLKLNTHVNCSVFIPILKMLIWYKCDINLDIGMIIDVDNVDWPLMAIVSQ